MSISYLQNLLSAIKHSSNMNALTPKSATGYFFSTVLMTIGVRAILDPVGQAKVFGPQISGLSSPAVPYVLAMGGRNIAFGGLIGALTWRGDLRTTGLVFYAAVMIEVSNIMANWRYKQEWTSALWSHVGSLVAVPVIGWWMRI